MRSQSSLHTLIDLAQQNADEAARGLRELNGGRKQALEQLTMLLSYRQDYADRLQQAVTNGVSASNYRNFRQFIATLDEAISQQNKVVAQFDLKVERGRSEWLAEKRRLGSFETLQARKDKQQLARDTRNEQRSNDEISANLIRRAHARS